MRIDAPVKTGIEYFFTVKSLMKGEKMSQDSPHPDGAAPAALKKTPLHARHLALGAKTAPFAGWDMPLWYAAGAVREHLAVVTAAGLFDTSHMDVILVSGSGAQALIDSAFTRDVSQPRPERAVYGLFLDAKGCCLDDAIFYPLPEGRIGLVVNAGMGQAIIRHLASLPGAKGVEPREPSPRLAKLDLQGPASVGIMRELLADPAAVLAGLPYFAFKGDFDLARSGVRLKDGTPLLLSRTGYTGEIGFEIFLPSDKVGEVWDTLLRMGGGLGVLPCGLAARDSLRAGAVLPLSHQDIGPWPFVNNPWSFALPTTPDGKGFAKKFVGDDAVLAAAATAKHTLPFVGMDQRRVETADGEVLLDGAPVGRILTIVTDMAIGRVEGKVVSVASPGKPEGWTPRGLACGFVMIDRPLPVGAKVTLRDKRRSIDVEIASDIRPDRTARRKLVNA